MLFQPKYAMSGRAGARARSRLRPHMLLLFVFFALSQIASAQNNNAAATATANTDTNTDTETKTTDATTKTADTTTSSTSIGPPVVTVPPTDGAPYMQTSSTPEGAVFIAVGAVLGFLGLAVLAWRGLVAWSVNRSVRQSAMMQSSETKGLLRSSRRKRYGPRSKEYSFPSVSGKSSGGGGGSGGGGSFPTTPPPPPPHGGNRSRSRGHRRSGSGNGSGSSKPLYIVPRSNSGLFYSPTAQSRRDPPPPRTPPHYSSYPYPPAQARHQHQNHGSGSGSSPGSGSRPGSGPAPTEYLDGLFDNHTPPRRAQRQHRPPDGYNRRRG